MGAVCVIEHAHQTEPLIDAVAAGEILGRPAKWMYVEAAAGRIPSYKIGGTRKFRASELEAFIRQHAEGPRMAVVTPLSDRRR